MDWRTAERFADVVNCRYFGRYVRIGAAAAFVADLDTVRGSGVRFGPGVGSRGGPWVGGSGAPSRVCGARSPDWCDEPGSTSRASVLLRGCPSRTRVVRVPVRDVVLRADRSGGPGGAAGQEPRGNCCRAKRFARTLYNVPVIRSFADKATERLSRRESVPAVDPRIRRIALRKLRLLDSALSLEELRVLPSPPGNRLERLKGDRSGQYSIRINDRWRICFRWSDAGPEEVEIVDYH